MVKPLKTSPFAVPLPELENVPGVGLGAVSCGLRYRDRPDLMMMTFPPGTSVAGVFTKNKCPGAPVDWCKAALSQGVARALVVNAGNANVFTGRAGVQAVQACAAAAAREVNCTVSDVFLASTGVIGEPLDYQKIVDALPNLMSVISEHSWEDAARAIMTTDTFPKAVKRRAKIGDTEVILQGIAKGSGMVAPDMATMLSFIATDACLPHAVIQTLLTRFVATSFNAITVDSDTSTSDMTLLFATGKAQHRAVRDADDAILEAFAHALEQLMHDLALMVVGDGEGASKRIEISVHGAIDDGSAKRVAMAIGNSPLVKTAIAGEDANWGRIVMAVGKSGEPANRDTLTVAIGGTCIARQGTVVENYDEGPVVVHMRGSEIVIDVGLGLGDGCATIWTCDLTHGYIDINGSYRS